MRITVHPSFDVEARPGATVLDVCDAARAAGLFLAARPWCGDILLDSHHPVGTWPLLEGAILSSDPSPPCAPPRGRVLRVLAGPDAGAWAAAVPGATIGRDPSCSLAIADPTLSTIHASVVGGRDVAIKDADSANGTIAWEAGERTVGRRIPCRPGVLLSMGSSLIAVEDADDSADAPPPRSADGAAHAPSLGGRLAPLAGSLGTGFMMAAMTGRWWLLLVGCAYPAYVAAPILAARVRGAHPPPDVSAVPCLLPESRAFWRAASGTIAITGTVERARGFARAVLLARGTAPRAGAWAEAWTSWLAPPTPGDPEVVLVDGDDPPSWADVVVTVSEQGASVDARGRTWAVPPVAMSLGTAEAVARSLAGASRTTALPTIARLADLDERRPRPEPRVEHAVGAPRRLAAPLGISAHGPLTIDLDAHGPHLLVAGTTGSGKSALLETLVLALADRWGPADLSIALIDFKGGAGLRSCMGLPHVAGTLTDLDPHLARRALAALAQEIADRKRSLAAAGHASYAQWEVAGGAPPRLLVVADEYQELVAHYRDFLPDLTRLAAQGRSLGLHLVLATQRPAGAVTPEIRANVGATLALRVASEAESRDLVGSAAAAELPRDIPGRAILAVGSERTTFQTALPTAEPSPLVSPWSHLEGVGDSRDLSRRIEERWSDATAQTLWFPPLPDRLAGGPPPGTTAGTIWLGLGDLATERLQRPVTWDPSEGPLLVVGPARSGRSTLLSTIAAQSDTCALRPVWLPSDPREAARTIALARDRDDWLLLVDDGAQALASLAEADRGAPQEELLAMLALGRPVAFAAPLAAPQRLAIHASIRVVLAGGDPADEALWSVPRALHDRARLPGRAAVGTGGRWIEAQIGVLAAPEAPPVVAPLPSAVAAARLPEALVDGGVPIGIGGDDASIATITPERPVIIIGERAHARDWAAAAIAALARRVGVDIEPTIADGPLAVPRAVADRATIVVAHPTPRLVSEAGASGDVGLTDPRPGRGRAVVVVDGRGTAVQLAEAA